MPSPNLARDESRVLASLDPDALVEAVRRLVRIDSSNGNETRAQETVAELAAEAGLDVDVWEIDLDAVKAHPHCSYEIERDRALGVVGVLGATGHGRSLILNGHVDVVPAGDAALWTHPPFEGVVEDGRIHGRGTLDMKGPLMAGLFALRAIRDAGIELAGTAYLQSVVGEEDGGIGTLAAILRGYTADAAIVMEPTELAVAPVQAGCLNFRVRVHGRAAHGAVREEGISAFEKLFVVYGALEELERRRNARAPADPMFARYGLPFPISVGTIRGGDWASSVPDHAVMEGRLGVVPGESLDAARADLEEAVAHAAARDDWLSEHPPIVEWWGGRFLPSRTPSDHRLTVALAEAYSAVSGERACIEGVTFGADAGLLAEVGRTPAVLFGAGDIRRAHRPDEYIDIDELAHMARALAVTVMRFCA